MFSDFEQYERETQNILSTFKPSTIRGTTGSAKARAAFIQAARQTSPGTEGPEPDTRLPVDDLHINSTSLGD